ncbi:MAG: DEAD/DEAH box helicase [Alphaproteobacteria bacterium]|nr:DEAD/DEAH box helicase [Alphaproteobacteria bacterium]
MRAHHGSISHEARATIEEQLKRGEIPAIVATSSLELGIDMGAVDLVILVESPGSASRGLQRVGRAGHQVGAVSEGRIFPKFRGDLLEAAVVAQHMAAGEIEAMAMPRNCLDVLAQQVVAMVSQAPIAVDDLLARVRRAAPYADLSRDLLVSVLDMLSGRYPSDAFADLSPTISWDRATDVLSPRRSARLLAVLNGGTIPDRGLYTVHLGEGGPRLGELDEEMVYESRPGDTIILGASAWRIDDITRDRVLVTPAPGATGRLPFWRGERPGRPLELGRSVGAFLRTLDGKDGDEATAWLQETTPLDVLAAGNLVAYVAEQKAATGALPTDRAITLERFRDELGDWRVCLLTPFGSRVHAPWALALQAMLGASTGLDVEAFYSDDGIALRFADGDEVPSADRLVPEPEEVEALVVDQLRHAALFATRFREAAGRALLLPKRRARGRTPLWLQRRKSSELLAAALQFPAFPVVLETYRECLQDVFDLPALQGILTDIRRRRIRVDEVDTRTASPFARSLVFQYIAAYLYDGDAPLAERKAAALALDRTLLAELLGQAELRELLDADAVAEVEAELQHLADDRRVAHVDALHDLLRRLGDLSLLDARARATDDPGPWLAELVASRRALEVRIQGEVRWIAIEDASRYRDALGTMLPPGVPGTFLEPVDEPLEGLIRRYARTHGPFHGSDLAARYGLTVGVVDAVLRALEARGLLVHGELRPGGTRREWCDADVLRRLRQRSLARLRKEVAPVEAPVYARFLLAWHGVGSRRGGIGRLQEVLDQLQGTPLPFSVLEGEILRARVPDYQPMFLDQLGAMGEVVWIGRGALGTKDGRVALYRRTQVPILVDPPDDTPPADPIAAAVLDHLVTRGASFLTELQQAVDQHPSCAATSLQDLVATLWDLAWAGHVTNDTFQPLRGLSQTSGRSRDRWIRAAGGRWSAVRSLVGRPGDPTERAVARATSLLERYGVVSREAVGAEEVPGGFSGLYPVLKAMEESGRARRGWFVDGFSGAQFTTPGAVDRLRTFRDGEGSVVILAATDPASPWGGVLAWPPTVVDDAKPRRVAGAQVVLVDGVPAVYVGKGQRSLVLFQGALDADDALEAAIGALRGRLDHRSVHVATIDGLPAATHPAVDRLVAVGMTRDPKGLTVSRAR